MNCDESEEARVAGYLSVCMCVCMCVCVCSVGSTDLCAVMRARRRGSPVTCVYVYVYVYVSICGLPVTCVYFNKRTYHANTCMYTYIYTKHTAIEVSAARASITTKGSLASFITSMSVLITSNVIAYCATRE
jgi:hypothetical protein